MLLDYERYQVKSKKRKKRKIVLFFFILVLVGGGAYLFISEVILKTSPLELLAAPSPIQELDRLWTRFIELSPETDTAGQEEKLTILTDLLEKSQALLADTPLDLRALVYHGYASYYRARFEHSFETRLPYYNQALVSLRRARIIADPTLEGQLAYMLGRIYFYKRDYFYDLAERYLEQAIHLGYKGQESYEYLVVINDAWGNAERSIEYLEKVLKERTDDMYLFRLAGNYWKVGRTEEAVRILEGIINRTDNENLGRECRFLLGEISFAAGKFSAAEAQYRSILEKDDDSAEAHFRLALIYEKKGDYVQYRYQLRRTLENDPGHSGARSRLR